LGGSKLSLFAKKQILSSTGVPVFFFSEKKQRSGQIRNTGKNACATKRFVEWFTLG
jgi:hypothetical protein